MQKQIHSQGCKIPHNREGGRKSPSLRGSILHTQHVKTEACSAASLIFQVPVPALEAQARRNANVAHARQTAMYLAHVVEGLPLRTVGQVFGRDRTTVAHGCAAVEDRRDSPCFDRTLGWMELAMKWSNARLLKIGADAAEYAVNRTRLG